MAPTRSRNDSTIRHDDIDSDEIESIEARVSVDDVERLLLATDLPREIMPDKQFQQTVLLMSCIFIALVETYSFLTIAPIQEIMEDFICHSHYPDHMMNKPMIQDQRCKQPDVQKTLAMVRSWWQTCELWVRKYYHLCFLGLVSN